MEWIEFRRKHPKTHLVAGEYDPEDAFARISHFGIVGRLILALRPAGDWAMQKTRLHDGSLFVLLMNGMRTL
jgi:hypothetical protein